MTAWSATNKNSRIVLSNGSLTATADTSVTNTHEVGWADGSFTTGQKIYWEVHVDALGGDVGVGVVNSSASHADGDFLGSYTDAIGEYENGAVWYNFGEVATANPTFAAGDTVCVAVDFNAGLIWWRTNAGNWNNSGTADPSTGTGGITVGITGALFPAYSVKYDGTTQSAVTANFGATTFAHTMPSGFSSLDVPAGTVAISATSSSAMSSATRLRTGAGSIAAASAVSASAVRIASGATVSISATSSFFAAGATQPYDGLYGDGLYGAEYYSARIQDQAEGPVIIAATTVVEAGVIVKLAGMAASAVSGWADTASMRLRTSALAILVATAMTAFGRKFWDPDTAQSATWVPPTPGTDPWSKSAASSATWTKPAPGTDPWTKQADPAATWTVTPPQN